MSANGQGVMFGREPARITIVPDKSVGAGARVRAFLSTKDGVQAAVEVWGQSAQATADLLRALANTIADSAGNLVLPERGER